MGALKKETVGEGPKMNNGAGISKISGATPSDGKGGVNVKSKLGDKSDHLSTSAMKVGGLFVAFSADYHAPRRHPPIHN